MARPRTAKQKAALKKAQAASARKRRGKGKGKLAAANRRNTGISRRRKMLAYSSVAAGYAAIGYAFYLDNKNSKKQNVAPKSRPNVKFGKPRRTRTGSIIRSVARV